MLLLVGSGDTQQLFGNGFPNTLSPIGRNLGGAAREPWCGPIVVTVMGNCRPPIRLTREMAEDRFDAWRLINEQRMLRNGWSFSGSPSGRGALQPTLSLLRSVADRNDPRSHCRFLRARPLASQVDIVDVWEYDVHYVEPSDDESLPTERTDTPLNLPEYFSLPLSSLDPRLTTQSLERQGDT